MTRELLNGNGPRDAGTNGVEAVGAKEGRVPPRDVVRDPRAPDLGETVGTWPGPEAGEAGAIAFGSALYPVTEGDALGDGDHPGLVPGKVGAATDLRLGTVHAERAEAVRGDQQVVDGAATRELIQMANGAAAEQERQRLLGEDLPRRERDVERAEAQVPAAQEHADVWDDAVRTGDVVEQDDTLLRKLAVLLVFEVLLGGVLLYDAVSAQVAIPLPILGPLVVALGLGVTLTAASLVVGAILRYALPKVAGPVILGVLAAVVFVRLAVHLDALRLGEDRGTLALADAQLLGCVTSAFLGWAAVGNLGFAEVRRARTRAHERLAESRGAVSAARAALENVFTDAGANARLAAETPARVLGERVRGIEAATAISATRDVFDGVEEAERAHGRLRTALGVAAWRTSRNVELLIAAGAGMAPRQDDRRRVLAVGVAVVAVLAGAALAVTTGSVVPLALGAGVAAAALMLGLGRRDPGPPAPADPPGTARALGRPRRPWIHLPRRQTGGGAAGTATEHEL